ncbi:unnamed protein product, partial [Prorocentrum cordatum]
MSINNDFLFGSVAAPDVSPKRKKSRKSRSDGGSVHEVDGRGSQHQPQPDGRKCIGCNLRDSDEDPVDGPGSFVRWAHPPVCGKTQGGKCWYCNRSWFTGFRHAPETGSFEKLMTVCGTDDAVLQKFNNVRSLILDKCVKQGSRHIHVRANEVKAVVTTVERTMVSLEDDDDVVELECYKNEYHGGMGDPVTNGKGHTILMIQGVMHVRVPGPPVKKLKRCQQSIVDVTRMADDGSLALSDTHAADVAQQLSTNIGAHTDGAGERVRAPPAMDAVADARTPKRPTQAASQPSPSPPSSSSATGARPMTSPPQVLGMQVVVPALPGAAASPSEVQAEDASAKRARPPASAARPAAKPRAAAAKASAAPAPSGAGGGAGGKAGRKRRNLVSETEKVASQFQQAAADDKTFFGLGHAGMVAWLKRLCKDYAERIPTIQEYDSHILGQKIAKSILSICTAWKKHGLDSSGFAGAIKDAIHFLEMLPAARTDFLPDFIRMSEKKFAVSACPADSTFWPMLSRDSVGMTEAAPAAWEQFISEMILDKLIDCLELKDGFEPQIAKLFECPDALDKADLTGDVQEQVKALEMLVKGATSPVETLHAWSRADLVSAMAIVNDKQKKIANCPSLCAPGRKLVQRMTLRVESLVQSDAKIETFIAAVRALVGSLPERCSDLPNVASALKVNLDSVIDELRRLGQADIKRTDQMFTEAAGSMIKHVFVLYERFFEWGHWLCKSAAENAAEPWPESIARSALADLEGPLAAIPHAAQFKALCSKLDITTRVTWEQIDGARVQMSTLLSQMPDALKVLAQIKNDTSSVTREDASLFPRLFYNFEMKFGWVKMICEPGADAQVLARCSEAFAKALEAAYYEGHVAEKVAKCIAEDPIVKSALDEIWDGIPAEFLSNTAPAQVRPLCKDAVATANLIGSIGDAKLAQQFQVLQDCHVCASTRANMKARRGAQGPTFSSEDSEAFVAARSTLASARTSLARPSLARCFNGVEGGTPADAVHLPRFDGCVDPVDLSNACINALESELGIWAEKWRASAQKLLEDVEGACPRGWQVYKDQGWALHILETLMDDVNENVRQSLLGSAKFQDLSGHSQMLCEWQKTMKIVSSRSGGSATFDPNFMKMVKSTLALGVDTVTTTFALFKLTGEISEMRSRVERKKAIRALRE